MEKRCGCSLLVQRSFLDLRISARISDTGDDRGEPLKQASCRSMVARNIEMDQAGVAGHGPDCLSIANGAQAAHVTGTPNVYRMDRSVFQVLQERSPACQDCRCGKRPCAGHTASSSCATSFVRNARVYFSTAFLNLSWKGGKSKILAVPRSINTENKLFTKCVLLLIKQNKVTKQYYATRTDVPEATEHIAAFPICFWYCLEW
ncbi:hypothetical protein ALC57_09780 [Trachymyrmex cornetzi]|uniref:Uncharacterized protein n=1 Tax=Trachymyrmex cornetzi TaxID=471704 RepID=A0A195DYD9_9HYME|nr:hypothetical protein ALC57_09780 [Trachymyrmex cornetzi]